MPDLRRADRIEVYSMIEEANLTTTGDSESNRTEKIPQVLADFHACVSKMTELQEKRADFDQLSPKDQAEAFIAAVSVNHILDKVEPSLTTDKLSPQEIIAKCGVTEIYEDALNHFDTIEHPDAIRSNPYIEDRAVERISHFYTDYSHAENDTVGVENYSCYLLPDEENTIDPDDPFRTETNPDHVTFLMESNESKMADYKSYTDLSRIDPVEKQAPESIPEPDPPEKESRPDLHQDNPVHEKPAELDQEIFGFVSSAVHFPLEILNAPETADYITEAQGEKGLHNFQVARLGLINAIRGSDRDGVTRFAAAIQTQLDRCEKDTGYPLEIQSLRGMEPSRLEDLGSRAFAGPDGKMIRLNQTDPWQAWSVLKYDIAVLTTGREEWESTYGTEKPSAIGAAGRCVAGFLGLISSLSGTGIFTAYSNAVYRGLLDYADRVESSPDRVSGDLPGAAADHISLEAVAKYSAVEVFNLLENPASPEIEMLKADLGEAQFGEYRTEVREYLESNDSSHWERAQQILEGAKSDHMQDVDRDKSDTASRSPVSRDLSPVSHQDERYIVRLREIDAHQGRHGDFTSLFSFDSNGQEYKSGGIRRLDPRDFVESFKYMTAVIEAYARDGKMDFQLTGRDMHEGKSVGVLDIFMSVNQFIHTDIGYTIIKYAFEYAKDSFVDIRAAETKDVFEAIMEGVEQAHPAGIPDSVDLPAAQDSSAGPEAPPPNDTSREESEKNDLAAASSEDDEIPKAVEDKDPHPDDTSDPVESDIPNGTLDSPPETPQDTQNPVSDLSVEELPSRPESEEAERWETPPPVIAVQEAADPDFTQISSEAKEAIAAYLDPSDGGTQTFGEIYGSLTEKYPDADYNGIDFVMDAAEVFSGNVEAGAMYSPDTAAGLLDNMYELIMGNEPISEDFSREELYEMTFREITGDDGEPVCLENLFFSEETHGSGESTSGRESEHDEFDFSAVSQIPENTDLSGISGPVSLDIPTDEQSIPSAADVPENSLIDYYTSAVQEQTPDTSAADPSLSADLTDTLTSDTLPDDIPDSVDFTADPVSVPIETETLQADLPDVPDTSAADTAIPEEEIRLSQEDLILPEEDINSYDLSIDGEDTEEILDSFI